MKKNVPDSNFFNLVSTSEKNNLKPEIYIKTNVEAPRNSTNTMSSILIIISGPATRAAMVAANIYQMPFDIIFFIQ
ncbi:hypothetical protein CMT41_16500 [Colwellia sp. MT41]|nr:hypothetical protein CMT41_16500 [Colwellia sp. MT41]